MEKIIYTCVVNEVCTGCFVKKKETESTGTRPTFFEEYFVRVSITKLKNYNTGDTARKSNIKNYKENIVFLKKNAKEEA